jgi:hypothetical protein
LPVGNNGPEKGRFVRDDHVTVIRRWILLLAGVALVLSGLPAAAAAARRPARLLPHLGVYDFLLVPGSSSSFFGGAARLAVELRDVCNGYSVRERFVLVLYDEAGFPVITDTRNTAWESYDSARYRFHLSTRAGGRIIERFDGQARAPAGKKPGRARYQTPEGLEVTLPAGVIFPGAHMRQLIERAQAGKPMLWRSLFDGAGGVGAQGVSAFIGQQKGAPVGHRAAPGGLSLGRFWPVRLAFFSANTQASLAQASLPDYEMSMRLHENGVISWLRFDYDDFSLIGKLGFFRPLPAPAC